MAAFQGDSIFWIETHKIVPNPYQPRREFDEQKLKELAESIRMYGVLQPLTVSRKEVNNDDGAFKTEYELIAGERRLRASKLAGVEQVPVIIREGEDSEQEKLELAIIENLQREDLNAVDRALAFKQLADTFSLSHSQVAKKVGRSREYVSNSIRLLNLPEYMLDSVKTGDITEGHARTLLMLNDRPEEQDTLYRETLMKKLTVREVERIARKIATDKVRVQKWKGSDPELIEKEKQFTETLGTRVQLLKTEYGGRISIDYFSDEDLDTLLETLARSKAGGSSVSPVTSAATAVGATTTAHTTLESLEAATPLEPVIEPVDTPVSEVTTPHQKDLTDNAAPEEELVDTPTAEPPNDPTPEAVPSPHTPADSVNSEVSPVSNETKASDVVEPPTQHSPLRAKLAQLFQDATPPSDTPVPEEPVSPPEQQPPPAMTPAEESAAQEENGAGSTRAPDDDDLYGVKHFGI